MKLNDEVIIREVTRLNLQASEVLIVHLPADIILSDEQRHQVKEQLTSRLSKAGLKNEVLIVSEGVRFEAISPEPKERKEPTNPNT